MYKHYIEDLVTHYHALKENGNLAPRLINPTPSSIKEECISLFEVRNSRKDMPVLLTFFRTNDEAELKRIITKCDRDRFRPLANFLVGRTIETEDPNINLLAWLIDFQRPYKASDYAHKDQESMGEYKSEEKKAARDIPGMVEAEENEEGESVRNNNDGEAAGEKESTLVDHKKNKRPKRATSIIWTAGILLLFAGIFRNSLIDLFTGKQRGCMIWAGDRFIRAECETKHGDTMAVPFDRERFDNFKRILRPDIDTITYYSVGKLFYFLRKEQVEIYTREGNHPVYKDRYLRPLSSTIIDKYVRHN